MINIKFIIQNSNNIIKLLKERNFNININFLKKSINEKNKIKVYLDHLRNIVKKNSKNKNNNINNNNFKKIKFEIKNLKIKLKKIENELNNYCLNIPNIPNHDVPKGNSKLYNKNIKYYGEKKEFNFNIKDYLYICKKFNYLDFKYSSLISGSKFVFMKNKLSLINRALIQFMLDVHINKNFYNEIYSPLIVNEESLYGTGQLPKFYKDIFYIKNILNKKNKSCLIPTSEVTLVNLAKNKIFLEKDLPIKYVSCTTCFRHESNSYGENSKGLIRLNQFDKVELVQIVNPVYSNEALENITNHAENILKLLNLHYRKVLLCSGEMSFSSCKTYDLEVWFPYKKKYIEVSSCSNTSDFQSRRISSKFKNSFTKKNDYVHILNGSGLAIGRTLAAIIENYQNINEDFDMPKILEPYTKSYI